jgi:trimethylamine--corrinoid protein Co-methyltransferase
MPHFKLSKPKLMTMLTHDEMQEIHATSLDILEQVGIMTNSQRIIQTFRANGADVQPREGSIKIPDELVKEALKKVPKETRLYGRGSKNELTLEHGRVYFGLGGTPLGQIVDLESGKPRSSTKKDVEDATRLGDSLQNYAFIMSIGGAFDTPHKTQHLHELEGVFANTEKFVVWALPGAYNAKQAILMASVVAGGMEELRRKPILSCYSESISPLKFSTENEDLIEFAAAGMPIFFTGCPMLGVTGPATVGGTYSLGNAETLAALTLSQFVNPGTPFVYGPGVGVADLRNLRFSFAAPEYAMGHIIQSQLAEFYQIPTFGWGGCSDSKIADTQAGAEAMFMSMMSAMSGTNMIHCCGYLSGSEYGSMEMAVICDEVAAMIYRLLDGMDVDKESLALDVVREVGPKGNYLNRKHTRAHLKNEVFVPKLFDRDNERIWMSKGGKNIREVAKARVYKLLDEHRPTPLPEDTKAALARIVREADETLSKGTAES